MFCINKQIEDPVLNYVNQVAKFSKGLQLTFFNKENSQKREVTCKRLRAKGIKSRRFW